MVYFVEPPRRYAKYRKNSKLSEPNGNFSFKTSLLRRLQAQILPFATPPIGKYHPFSKIAVTFEPIIQF